MAVNAAVVDLDGTVYRGRDPLPGAVDALDTLRNRNVQLLFCSNNPTKTRDAYVERLVGMGITAEASEILSAGTVTTTYLRETHGDDDLYLVGSPGLRDQLLAADLTLVDDPEPADVLVASWDRAFDYDSLTAGLHALQDDETAFVGSDPDRVIPAGNNTLVPGSGAIIRAIAGVADRDPDVVLGKPSTQTIEVVRETLECPPAECLLVGDRLDTDIAMGERAGMETVLVLTGVTDRADLDDADVTPDHVVDALADVPSLLADG